MATAPTFRDKVYNSEVCTRAAAQLQGTVADKMSKFRAKHSVLCRLSAPVVYPIITLASVSLRIASVAEPIILGVPGDIFCAIHDRELKFLGHIVRRPGHILYNLFWGVIGSLKDVMFGGVCSIIGIFDSEHACLLMGVRSEQKH